MKIIVLRDTVFHEVGKPVIVCKASASPQPAPDWITETHAWELGVGCGSIVIPGKLLAVKPVVTELPAADVDPVPAEDLPAKKRTSSKA